MSHVDPETLFQHRDFSRSAIARRLKAARMLVSETQLDFATTLKISKQTYNSQESRGAPSNEVLDYLYRNKGIGPNFILFGNHVSLDPVVAAELAKLLGVIDSAVAKKSSAG